MRDCVNLFWTLFSVVVIALQKLMGNLLLHLKEGQRLDINCTKLLNDEVRNKRKIYEHSRLHECHDFRFTGLWLDLIFSFSKFSAKRTR